MKCCDDPLRPPALRAECALRRMEGGYARPALPLPVLVLGGWWVSELQAWAFRSSER